jgi:hypothetical protein
MHQEQGNTLIESMIALSLFSLITVNVSLLFLCNKTLEKKSFWCASANCMVGSVLESGYNTKQYPLDYWVKQLDLSMPGSELRIEFGEKQGSKSCIKILAPKGSGLSYLEYEF